MEIDGKWDEDSQRQDPVEEVEQQKKIETDIYGIKWIHDLREAIDDKDIKLHLYIQICFSIDACLSLLICIYIGLYR